MRKSSQGYPHVSYVGNRWVAMSFSRRGIKGKWGRWQVILQAECVEARIVELVKEKSLVSVGGRGRGVGGGVPDKGQIHKRLRFGRNRFTPDGSSVTSFKEGNVRSINQQSEVNLTSWRQWAAHSCAGRNAPAGNSWWVWRAQGTSECRKGVEHWPSGPSSALTFPRALFIQLQLLAEPQTGLLFLNYCKLEEKNLARLNNLRNQNHWVLILGYTTAQVNDSTNLDSHLFQL